MQERESALRALERRRALRRKRRIRIFLRIIIIVVITALTAAAGAVIIGLINNTGGSAGNALGGEKKLNLKTAEAPEYVDVQLINKGLARKGRKLSEIKDIVIHYTANPGTTAQNNRDYFNKPDTTVCSHFVIGLEGEIIQCVPLDERTAASNDRNIDTISIEVCHSDETGRFNDATYASLIKLTAWLCDNSGLDENNIIRHYDITGKLCPLYYVENEDKWEDLKQDVKSELEKGKNNAE